VALGLVELVKSEGLLAKYLQALMPKFCEGFSIELCAVRKVLYNHVVVLGTAN
jgi:hypothetical protein